MVKGYCWQGEGRYLPEKWRHIRQNREPFSKANFEFPTAIPEEAQPSIHCFVDDRQGYSSPSPISAKVSTSTMASSTARVSQIEPYSCDFKATTSSSTVSAPASEVFVRKPVANITTSRSGRVVKKPLTYDSYY